VHEEEPALETCPEGHASHRIEPALPENVPAAHGMHEELAVPMPFKEVPAGHEVHVASPLLE
jgi:hypothetical protein